MTISTAIQKENGKRWATLSVRDTGLGITEEEKARVFQRFFRGKASRKVGTPGTGLGLSICEEIIERHEGWISLESVEGTGSAFTIWLPLGPDSTAKERAS